MEKGEAEEPSPEDPIGDEKASEETVLEDATDTMLSKFPTLPTFSRTFQLSTCSRTLLPLPLLKPRFRTPRRASSAGVT